MRLWLLSMGGGLLLPEVFWRILKDTAERLVFLAGRLRFIQIYLFTTFVR